MNDTQQQRKDNMTRQAMKTLAAKIEEALKPLGVKEGLTFTYAGGSFDDIMETIKINAVPVGTSLYAREELEYKRWAKTFNLQENWLGEHFTVGNVAYKLLGLKGQKLIAQRIDGKVYLFARESVIDSFTAGALK